MPPLPPVQPTSLPGVQWFEPRAFEDPRGSYLDTFHEAWQAALPSGTAFVRDGQTDNPHAGTLRGLHAQRGLGKLVRVVCGAVFDVVVDLRPGSPTWGQHTTVELSAANRRVLWVPPDCAHGYLTLAPHSTVLYRFTADYAPADEHGVRWDDPELGIPWPALDPPPRMSERDRALPLLTARR